MHFCRRFWVYIRETICIKSQSYFHLWGINKAHSAKNSIVFKSQKLIRAWQSTMIGVKMCVYCTLNAHIRDGTYKYCYMELHEHTYGIVVIFWLFSTNWWKISGRDDQSSRWIRRCGLFSSTASWPLVWARFDFACWHMACGTVATLHSANMLFTSGYGK